MFGPIAHFRENSSYYSGKPPVRMTGTLPQITIMMPVYKVSEGFRRFRSDATSTHIRVIAWHHLFDRKDWRV